MNSTVKWYNWIFRYCLPSILRPKYNTWRFSFTILPHHSSALIINKNFHILSGFNPLNAELNPICHLLLLLGAYHILHVSRIRVKVNEMGSHWVLFLLYLNIVLNWPEDGRLRPKHVAKYNLIVIIASCLDVCCVLKVHNILYKFDNTQRDGLSLKKKK